MSEKILTHERLVELLDYNHETGDFFWKVNRTRGVKKGDKAYSAKNSTGYVQIGIDGKRYNAHRLAWFYVHKEFPYIIDHINRIRTDNRICNLRNVCPIKNSQNRNAHYTNVTGVVGVCFVRARNKFRSHIKINKKSYALGTFTDFELAKEARQFAEEFFWGNN